MSTTTERATPRQERPRTHRLRIGLFALAVPATYQHLTPTVLWVRDGHGFVAYALQGGP